MMKRKALRQVEVETAAQAGLGGAPETRGSMEGCVSCRDIEVRFGLATLYHSIKWNFSNLEGALEEGGELYKKSSKVYLFGATEKAIVEKEVSGCFDSWESPPSNALGLVGSVGEVETIISMKRLKMDREPYIPLDETHESLNSLVLFSHFAVTHAES